MSDRIEGAIVCACIAVGVIIYMGCGAILAHLIGINESTLAWWAMCVAWPLVLMIFAVIAWMVFTISYVIVVAIFSLVAQR